MKTAKWNMVKQVHPTPKFYLVGETLDDEIQPTEENVRLWAAAPELYDAIKASLNEFKANECGCDETPEGKHACYFHRISGRMERALNKATGGKRKLTE